MLSSSKVSDDKHSLPSSPQLCSVNPFSSSNKDSSPRLTRLDDPIINNSGHNNNYPTPHTSSSPFFSGPDHCMFNQILSGLIYLFVNFFVNFFVITICCYYYYYYYYYLLLLFIITGLEKDTHKRKTLSMGGESDQKLPFVHLDWSHLDGCESPLSSRSITSPGTSPDMSHNYLRDNKNKNNNDDSNINNNNNNNNNINNNKNVWNYNPNKNSPGILHTQSGVFPSVMVDNLFSNQSNHIRQPSLSSSIPNLLVWGNHLPNNNHTFIVSSPTAPGPIINANHYHPPLIPSVKCTAWNFDESNFVGK
jgi:hypothetical protein